MSSLDALTCGEAGGRVLEISVETGQVLSDRFQSQAGSSHVTGAVDGSVLVISNKTYSIWDVDGRGPVTQMIDDGDDTRVVWLHR